MALQARHRFIVSRLDQAFGIEDEALVEDLVREESMLEKINHFFSPEGPGRVFFFCEKRSPPKPAELEGEDPEAAAAAAALALSGGAPRVALYFSDGSMRRVPPNALGRAVYFMKRQIKVEEKLPPPLDPTNSTDGELSYGVIDSPLKSLEAMLRCLFKPMLETQNARVWGKASAEHQNEFMVGVDGFLQNVNESLKSLSGGLELRKPDPKHDDVPMLVAASNPAIVAHFTELLDEWCTRIETYLDDSDRSRWETPESGPATELEYWRRRSQRLTSITDQLKTKQCKSVIAMLTTVTKQPEDVLIDRQRVLALVRTWKQIDVSITEAANESKVRGAGRAAHYHARCRACRHRR